jgi:hypothetical protein
MTVASDLFYSSYASLYSLKNGWRPEKFIFILSHMRSGSTLLTHLLVSNPAICGYGETRTRYFSRRQFGILTGKVLYTLRRESGSSGKRYVLDKLLHDRFIGPDSVEALCGADVKIIFLLREPLGALGSLVDRLRHTEAHALDYYLRRLDMLQKYGNTLTPKISCVALTYDQLLHRTENIFRLLEHFLELDCSLMETYRILPTTGVRRVGDPSPKIRAGKIVRDEPARGGISDDTMKLAREGYEECFASLQNTCLTLDSIIKNLDAVPPKAR